MGNERKCRVNDDTKVSGVTKNRVAIGEDYTVGIGLREISGTWF